MRSFFDSIEIHSQHNYRHYFYYRIGIFDQIMTSKINTEISKRNEKKRNEKQRNEKKIPNFCLNH